MAIRSVNEVIPYTAQDIELFTSDLELRLESNSLSELHPAWGKNVIYYKSNV